LKGIEGKEGKYSEGEDVGIEWREWEADLNRHTSKAH